MLLTIPEKCAIIVLQNRKRMDGEEYLFAVAKRAGGRCEPVDAEKGSRSGAVRGKEGNLR